MSDLISHDRLLEILDYNRDTGDFTWKEKVARKTVVGARAGSDKPNAGGYLRMRICGELYYTHRLAWFYHHGEWPEHQIDHIDQNKTNNKLDNLRSVTHQENNKNVPLRANNTSGMCGIIWLKRRKKWGARIGIDGVHINLGEFDTFDQAAAARHGAEIIAGFHPNHGNDFYNLKQSQQTQGVS